jgi:membrane-associated phospholipid phosphatase
LSAGQTASVLGGISLAVVPRVFDINTAPPSCAPCDSLDVPPIDRWVIATERRGWDIASTVGELGIAAGTWIEMYRRPDGVRHVAASFEAAAWTFGIGQLSKAIIDRNRPILYTEDAVEAALEVDSHRSMPSGHTSISFALATSYWLSMDHKKGLGRWWPIIAAAGVGAMRMAAARHFTTDVLLGAALGTGTAIVIHEIRF